MVLDDKSKVIILTSIIDGLIMLAKMETKSNAWKRAAEFAEKTKLQVLKGEIPDE